MQSLADFLGDVDPDAAPSEPEVDLTSLTGKEFALALVNSREYRASVRDRVILGTLPAAVECKLLDYAYGKPAETVKHEGEIQITKIERVIVYPKQRDEDEVLPVTH